ncbi:MAG: SDR family NAD(P)-dependent oxidoreductase [Bryobacteraceae bacterium]
MLTEFKGKTALVTGASRGIGAATAVALARSGVNRVVLHYGSYREGAENALQAVRDAGAEGDLIGADLGCMGGIEEFLRQQREIAPKVDILINNAGSLVKRARLAEFTPDLFDSVISLNVKSLWFITQAATPHMLENGGGVIVNISSIAARHGGGPGATIYAAAKAAVSCITKGLAKEFAGRNIRVNAVSPGTVDNDFHKQFSTPEILAAMTASTPAGRLSTNDDIADVIVFLCSEGSRNIHGQTIEVNGGMYMV